MSINNNLISICLCTFNGEKYVDQQMESIVNQKDKRFIGEIIVCDDQSTDKTLEILKNFKKELNIKIYLNQKNIGVKKNFEKCLSLTRYPIIVFCDQDDIWHQDKISEILESKIHIEERPFALVHNALIIDSNNQIIENDFMKLRGGFTSSFFMNFYKNRFLGCCIAINENLKKELLPFPKNIPQHDIWIGIVASLLGNTKYLNKKLTFYRRHSSNTSGASSNKSSKLLKIIQFRLESILCIVFLIKKRLSLMLLNF